MTLARIDDIQMAYTDSGIGRPVVLIHGYPFNRTLWNEQVAALSTSYRVIAPDLRGFGESDASDGSATMNRMAQDVALLLNHLGITRATIAGLSMGGYVALAFYKQFPSRVRALILADTRAQADTEGHDRGEENVIKGHGVGPCGSAGGWGGGGGGGVVPVPRTAEMARATTPFPSFMPSMKPTIVPNPAWKIVSAW